MWVKFRGEWARKGVNHAPGDVVDVEDWEAERLIALGKARLTDAPPVDLTEPTDEQLLDALMADGASGEDEGPQFKSGSIPEVDGTPKTARRERKFK